MLNRYVDWVTDNIIENDRVMQTIAVLLGTVMVGGAALGILAIIIKAVF